MGSVRFGMVADSLSQGLGLFTMKKADEEKARVERQWKEAMEETRNRRADERADKASVQSAEQFRVGQENQTARAESANTRIVEEGKLNRSQRDTQFELERTDKEVRALEKQISDRYESAIKQIEKMPFPDELAEENILKDFGNFRDRKIEALVIRLGKRGAPGFSIDDAGAYEMKLIELGMPTDVARDKTNQQGPRLWPQSPGVTGQPGSPTAYSGAAPDASPDPFPTPDVTAVQAAERTAAQPPDLIPAGGQPVQSPTINAAAASSVTGGNRETDPNSPFYQNPLAAGHPEIFGQGWRDLRGAVKDKPWIRNPVSRERMGLEPRDNNYQSK